MVSDPLTGMVAGGFLRLGALAVATLEVGTVGDVLADTAMPSSYTPELTDLATDLGLASDAPGARLLYGWVADRIERTRIGEPGQVWAMEESGALVLPVYWSTESTWNPAASVLHLPGHVGGRPHTDCRDGWTIAEGTDDTWDGTQGFVAWVFLRVLENASADRRDEAALRLMHQVGMLCAGVDVPDEVFERGGFEEVTVAR